jgi:hypothetical protein
VPAVAAGGVSALAENGSVFGCGVNVRFTPATACRMRCPKSIERLLNTYKIA